MKFLELEEIRQRLDITRAYEQQREGFIAHALGKSVNSVSHFHANKGSFHIKSGMMTGGHHVFVKLSAGFSDNWRLGLPTGDGCILGFSSSTGLLELILIDRGYLTDLRTALAARLCVETFLPEKVLSVGILGTGTQARLCAVQQFYATRCRNLFVFGRNPQRVQAFKSDMAIDSFQVTPVENPTELLEHCDLVITTTASREPLLHNTPKIRSKLIVALGADECGKQELDPELVARAECWIADDTNQSVEIGEFQHAVLLNYIKKDAIRDLGTVLRQPLAVAKGLTICDLSGLPIQDAQIANSVLG